MTMMIVKMMMMTVSDDMMLKYIKNNFFSCASPYFFKHPSIHLPIYLSYFKHYSSG